jgi:glycosyltransferase involved in cell wall biosynthesis
MVDGIVVISSYLERKFRSKFEGKIPIIHLPVSAINIIKTPAKLTSREESIKILYSGTYGKKDGVFYILNSMKKISEKYNRIKLYLTGNPSLRVREKVSNLELNNFIVYTGFLSEEEYFSTLHSSDILLMTRVNTRYANAGFPFKIAEYLASGKPVIATKISDIEYYLEDNKNAILIQPNNSDEITSAVEKIINDRDNAERIGLNGKNVAKEHFNPEKHANQLMQFILKLV